MGMMRPTLGNALVGFVGQRPGHTHNTAVFMTRPCSP
jgi:hypothetical protein